MPIQIDTFGSCVTRDIFRYADTDRYQVNVCIQRNPITSLFQEKISCQFEIPFHGVPNYEARQLKIQMEQRVPELLTNSNSNILIMDLAEERLHRYRIKTRNKNLIYLTHWPKVEPIYHFLLDNDSNFIIEEEFPL